MEKKILNLKSLSTYANNFILLNVCGSFFLKTHPLKSTRGIVEMFKSLANIHTNFKYIYCVTVNAALVAQFEYKYSLLRRDSFLLTTEPRITPNHMLYIFEYYLFIYFYSVCWTNAIHIIIITMFPDFTVRESVIWMCLFFCVVALLTYI